MFKVKTTIKTDAILTPEAIAFLKDLHYKFNPRRLELLKKRKKGQEHLNAGERLKFLPETEEIRNDPTWKVAPTPKEIEKRFVEITGPTDRKMVINAMNSGADVFMADFEDANSPTFENMIEGQQNLIDAVNRTIELVTDEGKSYRLNESPAKLFVRPRGWHLPEKHALVSGEMMSASLFDFGLFLFHNGKKMEVPCFYLPKLEHHLEARLWSEVFAFSEKYLGLEPGTIRATVLIETLPAAFQMEEILYELKNYSAGLNAGRWDYIFSIIKSYQQDPDLILPDRNQVTMATSFMQAYANLLVHSCHKRGAYAIGGMAAFIPSRKDPEINERALRKVTEDKKREFEQGFDGTWVAHPDLVPVARKQFENGPIYKQTLHPDMETREDELIHFSIPEGKVTEEGLRLNLNVSLIYLTGWLSGRGAIGIYNLMEDAATCEISRSQVWQWLHRGAHLEDETTVTEGLVLELLEQEEKKVLQLFGSSIDKEKLKIAKTILEETILKPECVDFITLNAYERLP